MSIFHQHSQTTLKYCSNVIYELSHELGSLSGKQGLHQYTTELVRLPRHYEKSINLHLQKSTGKAQKPLLNQKNLLPYFVFSLLHCSHFTCLNHQATAYKSSLFLYHHLSLSSLLCFCLGLPAYMPYQLSSQEKPLSWPQNLMPYTPPGTD